MIMKTKKIVLFAALALLMPVVAFGATFRGGDNPSVGSSETINDDLYIAGSNVSITGATMGDLFAAGQSILVSGQVRQDLFAGGNNVTVTSNVGDDAKIGGNTVLVQGGIGDDLMIGGNQITISNGQIGGDLVAAGSTINVEAPVYGEIRISGETVYINSFVQGNVTINANQLELGPKANLSANLHYVSPKEMIKDGGAKILGKITYEPKATPVKNFNSFKAFVSFWAVMKIAMMLVLAFLLGLLFKRYSVKAVETAFKSPWSALGKGLLTAIVLPVVSIILLVTVVGIPLGILGIVSIVALCIFVHALTPILMGSLLFKWISRSGEFKVNWKTILLGVVVYSILGLIPFVGCIITGLFCLGAIGTITSLKLQIVKEWR
jgi:carbonic anhydrase/acetyltransferase-like protein (isoleucine patch superfamily)